MPGGPVCREVERLSRDRDPRVVGARGDQMGVAAHRCDDDFAVPGDRASTGPVEPTVETRAHLQDTEEPEDVRATGLETRTSFDRTGRDPAFVVLGQAKFSKDVSASA